MRLEKEHKYIAEYLHDSGIRYMLAIEGVDNEDAIIQAYDMIAHDATLRSVTNQNGHEVHVG